MSSWNFYADVGLTTLATGGAAVAAGGSPTDRIIYFGSPAAGKTLQAASAPGTDPISISVTDANAGTGAPVTSIRLALSSSGLGTATPGAALNVGTTLTSGPAGVIPIYVRTSQGALTVGTYADLSLQHNAVIEA